MKNKSTLPKMYATMLRTNVKCPTSVAAESVFSEAGFVQRKERTRLSSKQLRFTIMLKDEQEVISLEKEFFP